MCLSLVEAQRSISPSSGTWCVFPAHSGCQSSGCQRITAQRQSATRHRLVGLVSFGTQRTVAAHGSAIGNTSRSTASQSCLASKLHCGKVKANAAQASINTWGFPLRHQSGLCRSRHQAFATSLTCTLNSDAKSWACLRHLMPSFWYPAALRASGAG
jgi:hypothetical protein